tara:strand:- start:761 stop:871 length:111 start_codon:yes stop_codon:yes gene_type:complete
MNQSEQWLQMLSSLMDRVTGENDGATTPRSEPRAVV